MDEVSTEIAAPRQELWAMVADVTRMGEWSPECHRCEWLDGVTEPMNGAKFKGWNKRRWVRWTTTSQVVRCDPGDEFSFQVAESGARWSFVFADAGDGATLVTQRREDLKQGPRYARVFARLLLRDQDTALRSGMKRTLRRLKTEAERA